LFEFENIFDLDLNIGFKSNSAQIHFSPIPVGSRFSFPVASGPARLSSRTSILGQEAIWPGRSPLHSHP
jgi:hypothetical protein